MRVCEVGLHRDVTAATSCGHVSQDGGGARVHGRRADCRLYETRRRGDDAVASVAFNT